MKTLPQILASVRRLIGNPSVQDVANEQIQPYVVDALEWLGAELELPVETDDDAVALTEDQAEYALPGDCLQLIFVEWNDRQLQPASNEQWDREGRGYRQATAATPAEYAVLGRTLCLNPPPDDDALGDDGFLSLRFLRSPELDAGGAAQFLDADLQAAEYQAARLWCIAHPTDENMRRLQGFSAVLKDTLPQAKRRQNLTTTNDQPAIALRRQRRGPAR